MWFHYISALPGDTQAGYGVLRVGVVGDSFAFLKMAPLFIMSFGWLHV